MAVQIRLAPAKLNLFLRITGRRADGYHLLQTVFELIDWCDRVEVVATADGRIERESGAPGVDPEADLIVRAARALQAASGSRRGCRLRLHKSVPMGAGLGGGSSDAAAVLLALNELWALHWPVEQLIPIGLRLGADVPVFLGQHPAWAEGVGELLQAMDLPARHYLVLYPAAHVPTAAAFAAPDLVRDSPTIRASAEQVWRQAGNAFEAPVCRLYPAVAEAGVWMRQHFGAAHLSGSGSAWFVECAADLNLAQLPAHPQHWQLRVCRSWRAQPR